MNPAAAPGMSSSPRPPVPAARRTQRADRLFTLTVTVLLAISLVGMIHLQDQFQNDLESRLVQAQRILADRSVLKSPTEPWVRFGALEDIAAKLAATSGLSAITVGKVLTPPGVIRVVHPYYVSALYPQEARSTPPSDLPPSAPRLNIDYLLPWALPPDARTLPLEVDGQILGYLFVRVDQTTLVTVRMVLGTLFLLLVGAMVVLARQFRTQQEALSATTVELVTIRHELTRLERLAMAGQLSANLLHDLRKPVLNIRAELEDLESSGDQAMSAAVADEARGRMAAQVNLFFDILRETGFERLLRTPGEREFVDVVEIVNRSLALVRYERRGVNERMANIKGLPPVLSEPVRLVQIFSNLILNAYQAMQGQGVLTIWFSVVEDKWVEVKMEDTGPGIPAEMRARVFDPFVTSRVDSGGTGLGLYIVKETLLELGGQVELMNTAPTVGASFRILLPIEPAE
jgi:signal transduction histidine kinase